MPPLPIIRVNPYRGRSSLRKKYVSKMTIIFWEFRYQVHNIIELLGTPWPTHKRHLTDFIGFTDILPELIITERLTHLISQIPEYYRVIITTEIITRMIVGRSLQYSLMHKGFVFFFSLVVLWPPTYLPRSTFYCFCSLRVKKKNTAHFFSI